MMTLQEAQRRYVHRFTLEHVPAWARRPRTDGTFYAPQYRSDREWFENTLFPPHHPYGKRCTNCYSTGATWPLGQSLDTPFAPRAR